MGGGTLNYSTRSLSGDLLLTLNKILYLLLHEGGPGGVRAAPPQGRRQAAACGHQSRRGRWTEGGDQLRLGPGQFHPETINYIDIYLEM